MTLNTTYKFIFITGVLLLVTSCGSGTIVPTTDVCSLEKHWDDNLYQVKINDKKINTHWYLKEDALDITKQLAKDNKCMDH
ncbi:hypothetical protein BIY24_10825 [Halobacteriovorax marinus]|nr:hypothetical protein BIY24_10825 [Halobacteriovorax marinus]